MRSRGVFGSDCLYRLIGLRWAIPNCGNISCKPQRKMHSESLDVAKLDGNVGWLQIHSATHWNARKHTGNMAASHCKVHGSSGTISRLIFGLFVIWPWNQPDV